MSRVTNRDRLILYPVLFAIFMLIIWYGPDSFQTTFAGLR